MSEVKRYKYGYRDDGNGQRFLGLIESPDGSVVLASDYDLICKERDALRKQLDEARELLEECSDMADACEDQVLLGHIDAWLEATKP